MEIKKDKKRTLAQNQALHLWERMIADAYNEKGMTIEEVIKNFRIELFWTKEAVHELIIHTAISRMFGKRSTTQLLRNEGEIEKLIDVVTLFNSKMDIPYIPWPSIESLESKLKEHEN